MKPLGFTLQRLLRPLTSAMSIFLCIVFVFNAFQQGLGAISDGVTPKLLHFLAVVFKNNMGGIHLGWYYNHLCVCDLINIGNNPALGIVRLLS